MNPKTLIASLCVLASCWTGGCTIHHSKHALWANRDDTPKAGSTFVSEEDSGLLLFGVIQLSEPDHFAVLLERARRRYRCERMHHAQLDFYTDFWILVSFPIARVTLVCERGPTSATTSGDSIRRPVRGHAGGATRAKARRPASR